MRTDEIIQNLKYTAKKHENDKVFTGQLNISSMCKDILPKMEQLKAYEDAEEQGLLLRLPIEIRGVDERIIKYALAKAMCLFKYGVDVDSKLEGAVETSYALHQAYMRGSQDAIDEMHKRKQEIRNKAIDEFAEMIELEILTMLTSEQEYRIAKKSLDEIAEQMKGE